MFKYWQNDISWVLGKGITSNPKKVLILLEGGVCVYIYISKNSQGIKVEKDNRKHDE